MATKESVIQADVIKALNKTKRCLVKRNTVGVAVTHGRFITYGLGTGSTDLVGLLKGGRVFCLEIKTPTGKTAPARAEEQEKWREAVRQWGGFATVVRSVTEALEALTRAEQGESQ